MNASNERVHHYHADASPIGGYLTHPFESVLDSQGSVSLGQAGGHTKSRIEHFKLDSLIRSGAAYSQATGSVQATNGNWTTLVTSVVEDLNILEVVTADRLVSLMALEHERKDGAYYPKISFVGTQYENLRIAGTPITPLVDLNLLSGPITSKAAQSPGAGEAHTIERGGGYIEFPDIPWPDQQGFVNRAVAQAERILDDKEAPEWLKRRYAWMRDPAARAKKGYIACSLVNAVPGVPAGTSYGHVVHVPSFGNIFLGELLVDQTSFKLTMLRVEMGCMAKGNVSFASSRGNGNPMP